MTAIKGIGGGGRIHHGEATLSWWIREHIDDWQLKVAVIDDTKIHKTKISICIRLFYQKIKINYVA